MDEHLSVAAAVAATRWLAGIAHPHDMTGSEKTEFMHAIHCPACRTIVNDAAEVLRRIPDLRDDQLAKLIRPDLERTLEQ